MNVAHISDIHYAPETLDEVDCCFAYAVDSAIQNECECAVLSGDIFDHRVDLHSPVVNAVIRQVRKLSDAMPVLILQGTFSHDQPGSLDVFWHISGHHPVYVADKITQVALLRDSGKTAWKDSNGHAFDDVPTGTALLISALPAVNKGALAGRLENVSDTAASVGDVVYDLLKGWAPINLYCRANGIPTIVTSHGTVSGCVTEHGVPMAGLDHEYSTGSLFASEASACMLGHIHQNQEWSKDGRRIAYPGSVGRLHFGELNPKGFLIWEVLPDGASTRFVETPATRLVQADFDGAPTEQELAAIAEQAHDARVRIRYQLDEEHRHRADRKQIERMMLDAGAIEAKVEARINPVQRSRAEGIHRAVTLTDKLSHWGTVVDVDTTPLTGLLRMLEERESVQIVSDIIGGA